MSERWRKVFYEQLKKRQMEEILEQVKAYENRGGENSGKFLLKMVKAYGEPGCIIPKFTTPPSSRVALPITIQGQTSLPPRFKQTSGSMAKTRSRGLNIAFNPGLNKPIDPRKLSISAATTGPANPINTMDSEIPDRTLLPVEEIDKIL